MRHRRGLGRIRVVFTGDHLTRFGGVFLLHRFLQRLHLRRRFREDVRFPQRNDTYSIPEMLLALLYPIVLGLGRIETTELRQRNGVFQTLTGVPAYPNPTALRRFLRRFALRAYIQRAHARRCGGHVAEGNQLAISEVLDMLLGLTTHRNIKTEVDPQRMRPSDVPVLVGDSSKFRRATGWTPTIPFEKTVLECFDYWRLRV